MKKDVIVAILIGFLAGGLVAGLVLYLPSQLKSWQKSKETQKNSSPTPSITSNKSQILLEINSPKDETLFTTNKIKIAGKVSSGDAQKIVIDSKDESLIVESSASGQFESNLTLSEGANNIYFTLYNENGVSDEKMLTLYFTSEKL